MRILLIGAPGCGTGIHAKLLSHTLRLAHLSSGELLRRQIGMRTLTGRRVEPYVSRGELVPDTLVMDVLREPIAEAALQGGLILDGFPRNVQQAQMAHREAQTLGVDVQVAVHLEMGHADLLEHLLAWRRRADGAEEGLLHRLHVYREQTLPMLDYYARRGELITVTGGAPVTEVHRMLLSRLDVIAPRVSAAPALTSTAR